MAQSIPKNMILRMVDSFLAILSAFRTPPDPDYIKNPRRILVANGASLGDVVLSTAVLPALKSAFPTAELGMLISSGTKAVVGMHPLLRWVHVVDHWKMDRSGRGAIAGWLRYRRTRASALREIRSLRYDVAIDLYYLFPNSILLLWQAGIPVRIGYTSAGFGPLLTHPTTWSLRDCSVVDYHADLLRCMNLPLEHLSALSPNIPTATAPGDLRTIVGLGVDEEYLVLHIGTGFSIKEWPANHWRAVVERLNGHGRRLVFTGAGAREAQTIEMVIANLPDCLNLCNKLDWQTFVSLIAGARGLVGVDSVAGHVAAAVNTPCVVISAGNNNTSHWRPRSTNSAVLSHAVPCSPCYRQYGCREMECVRLVTVEDVLAEAARLFNGNTTRLG